MFKKGCVHTKTSSRKATMKTVQKEKISLSVLSLVNRGNALILIRKISQRDMN